MSECTSTYGPECPYCGYEQVADEGCYYDTDYRQGDCADCGKTFDVVVEVATTWTTTTTD